MDNLTLEQYYEGYLRMLRIRKFEMRAEENHSKGEIPGALHTSLGQEAEVVGACMALEDDDYMVGIIDLMDIPLENADMKPLMAEHMPEKRHLRWKRDRCISDFSIGSLGETSIVGSGRGCCRCGSRIYCVKEKSNFFLEMVRRTGAFAKHSTSTIWNLPVVFLCENNGWRVYASKSFSVENIADRAAAYSMRSDWLLMARILSRYMATKRAVDAACAEGPTLVEVKPVGLRSTPSTWTDG